MDNGETVNSVGSVGPFVKVTWNDAASSWKQMRVNGSEPSEHLTVCETIGELVAKDDKAIVLVMHGSQCDGVDIMAIPRDWCQKIEVLEIQGQLLDYKVEGLKKECIETSESQQESQNQKQKKN